MSRDLDALLDKCIDRINEGESLEECLASYPEYAGELEPRLRAICEIRDTCSVIPRPLAKSITRQRLDAALVSLDKGGRKIQRVRTPFWGWPMIWTTVAIALVLALIGFGLNWILTPGVAPLTPGAAPPTPAVVPVATQDNFHLLLSDEENAIGDFESLNVTITSIGMHRGDEGGSWEVIELEPSVVVDLTHLQGLNAQEIWRGNLPEGQYTQVFIYIENVIGVLKTDNGDPAKVFLPSGKLQISKPFSITTDEPAVNFVYDVTVVKAGQSGKYVLKPQIVQSGANQPYHKVGDGELTLQVVEGEVVPGEEITILVTFEGNPVEDALVEVNEEEIGETNADGLISFTVPDDDELEIKAVKDELEGELEIDLE